MSAKLLAIVHMAIALFWYPFLIGAALYIWIADLHWGWALALLALVLWRDPVPRYIYRAIKKRA